MLEYVRVGKYNPDYTLTYPNGHKVYIEAKGYFRPADRAKMLAVKRNNPDKDIRIVFANNGKVGKKMRYSDWAIKYKFPYAVGEIPKEWFKNG